MQTDIHFWSYLAQFCLQWEMFRTKVVQKIKTRILCSVTVFLKSCRLWDNVGKMLYSRHKLQYGACAIHDGYLELLGFSWNLICEYFWKKKNLSRRFKLHHNLTTITCTLHTDRYTFLIISRSVLLTMRNVSDKSCTENQNTHFVFSDFFAKIVPFMR